MSKYTLIKTIQIELEKLNQEIDLKIIKGHSYKREALRHKFLRKELRELTSKESYGFFQKTVQMAGVFLL